jgi:hypothetical protein
MHLSPHLFSSSVVILTGAGASVPLGKDTTAAFVDRCLNSSNAIDVRLLQNTLDDLKLALQLPLIDVEVVLDHLAAVISAYDVLMREEAIKRSLDYQQRFLQDSTALAPAAKRGLTLESETMPRPPGLYTLETLINVRRKLREDLLGLLVDHYCDVDEARAYELYKPLFNSPLLRTPIPVFTLNYDRAVEAVIDKSPDWNLIDGFEPNKSSPRWSVDTFRNYQGYSSNKRDIVLFKLHGSSTWGRLKTSDDIFRLPPHLQRNPGQYEHVIMYPSQAKQGLDAQPFRTAYSYLEECLEHTQKCVIIGTSFRDREINTVIRTAMRRSSKLRLIPVGPEVDIGFVAELFDCDATRIRPIRGLFGATETYQAILENLSQW